MNRPEEDRIAGLLCLGLATGVLALAAKLVRWLWLLTFFLPALRFSDLLPRPAFRPSRPEIFLRV